MDGPVVTAAEAAFEAEDADLVLPYVPKAAEADLAEAFEQALAAREGADDPAKALVERWFFETAVRLHREGEGEPFTGLKPAGLDFGPVIPLAEAAVDRGRPDELAAFLSGTVDEEIERRLRRVREKKRQSDGRVDAEREFVSAMLSFEVWAHHLYTYLTEGKAHGEPEAAVVGGHEH